LKKLHRFDHLIQSPTGRPTPFGRPTRCSIPVSSSPARSVRLDTPEAETSAPAKGNRFLKKSGNCYEITVIPTLKTMMMMIIRIIIIIIIVTLGLPRPAEIGRKAIVAQG
jgi:hypothetical protein